MKKILLKIITLVMITVSATNCKNETQYNTQPETKSDKIGIIINSNSSVRIQPYIYSSMVTTLQRGIRVDVIAQSYEKNYITGIQTF